MSREDIGVIPSWVVGIIFLYWLLLCAVEICTLAFRRLLDQCR